MKTDIYQIITDRIIKQLENGIIPWRKPWHGVADGARSYITGKPYSLLNQILLEDDGEYITFNQAKKLGGNVRKGAKSKFVVFYLPFLKEVENKDGEKKMISIPVLRYYNVFNVADCEGIEPHNDFKPIEHKGIEEAERVINEYIANNEPLKLQNDKPSNRAYYSPSEDKVVLPMLSQYDNESEYYSTAFHELTHSTLKADRCNRVKENELSFFGNHQYSREELVAELGSSYICGQLGITTDTSEKNSAGYIQSWLQSLKNDKKMIVWAASRAEKAANYILGITAESEEGEK